MIRDNLILGISETKLFLDVPLHEIFLTNFKPVSYPINHFLIKVKEIREKDCTKGVSYPINHSDVLRDHKSGVVD